ncbi:hypothetical protein ACC717_38500, partial [Rhizobium ruizarguesonis]
IKIGAGQGKANVVMFYFDKEKTIDVEKGENNAGDQRNQKTGGHSPAPLFQRRRNVGTEGSDI